MYIIITVRMGAHYAAADIYYDITVLEKKFEIK